MQRKLFFFAILSYVTYAGHAQCYQPLRAEGLRYEEAGNFEEAINRYLAGLSCPDKPRENDLADFIKRALQARVSQLEQAREEAETLQKKTADALASSRESEGEAKRQAQLASIAKEKADSIARIAQQRSEEVATALADLQRSNDKLIRLIVQNVRQDILHLEYESALKKIKSASGLGLLEKELVALYLEIAFWHNEAGHADRAVGILDSAAVLTAENERGAGWSQVPADSVAARLQLRRLIQQSDADTYQMLWERYYPVTIDVPGGTFTSGCDSRVDPDCRDNERQHRATVSDFQIARYETTWWQYHLFCQATGRRYVTPGWDAQGDNPVVNVNWTDAVEYANWVSRQWGLEEAVNRRYHLDLGSPGFRLPTEAEWEYSAKGARPEQKYVYSGSNALESVGWYGPNSNSRTQAVGQLQSNALGIYDMSGNVWEWCWDWYEDYPKYAKSDYAGPDNGPGRVLRGGSWAFHNIPYRLNVRAAAYQEDKKNDVGFRVARSLR